MGEREKLTIIDGMMQGLQSTWEVPLRAWMIIKGTTMRRGNEILRVTYGGAKMNRMSWW